MFRPYVIVGEDFVSGNNMCWNIVIVLQELLKRYHHVVSEIYGVGVILHLLRENVSWIDNSRNVFNVHIFGLMALSNPYFLGGLNV